MKEIVKKIKLLEPIDASTINIIRDHYFRNAYIVDLPLDSTPDHVWQELFENEWKSTRHLWDRKLYVIGDRLRLITSPQDIEDKLDWVKSVIVGTNNSVDRYNKEMETRTIQAKEQWKTRATEEERGHVDTIREVLRRSFG
jgi:hypothetical protein